VGIPFWESKTTYLAGMVGREGVRCDLPALRKVWGPRGMANGVTTAPFQFLPSTPKRNSKCSPCKSGSLPGAAGRSQAWRPAQKAPRVVSDDHTGQLIPGRAAHPWRSEPIGYAGAIAPL